jgi:septum formation protein
MRIVLASESPSRRRALDILGLAYEVCASEIDEKAIRGPDPVRLTLKLAEAKARKVMSGFADAIIVAGDAVAAIGDRIYEKPRDLDEAARFLRELSGSQLRFVTSLAVARSDTGRILSTVEVSELRFREIADGEVRDYIARYPVLKFAGAFEGDAVLRFAEYVSGSYNFVTGLPVSRLALFLRDQGSAI